MRSQTRFPLLIAVAVLAILVAAARADEYFERPRFEHLLAQRSALAVLVDRQGRLWVGTREGIARWDGSRIRHWRSQPFDVGSLGGNVMRGLLQDRRDDIWAFNPTEFYRRTEPSRLLGPTYERVQRYPFPGAFLRTDAAGEVVLVHDGMLYRFDATADAFVPLLRWSDRPIGVSEVLVETDAVWIATVDGRLRRCATERSGCREIATGGVDRQARITSMWRDRGGRLNVGLAAAGVALIDESAGALRGHQRWPRQWSNVTINANFRSPTHTLLLTTAGLIWRHDSAASDCPNRMGDWCQRPVPRGDGPADATIVAAAIDSHGVLWVGSNWGLSLHDPRAGAFRHWVSGAGGELDDGWVLSLAEDATGAIWAGTFNGRLYRIDPDDGSVETRLRLQGEGEVGLFRIIWAIVPMAGRLWLGTNNGLLEFQPDTGDFRVLSPPGSGAVGAEGDGDVRGDIGFVHALAADGADALWLGTNGGGAWRFERHSETFTRLAMQTPEWINHVLVDGTKLWLASANEGVFRVGEQERRALHYGHRPDDPGSLPSDTVWMLLRDRRGRLWAGTDSGLARLDPDRAEVYPGWVGGDLPSLAAMSVIEDRFGMLWIGTNSGLVRLDPDTGGIRRFDRSDGLASIEYNRRAALAASDGTLYFGGDRGIVAINPERIVTDRSAPRVRIDALLQRDQAGQRIESLAPNQALLVSAGQSQFGVRLSTTELVRTDRLHYQVRLAGLEAEWRELGGASEIFFHSVPPGRYRMEARVTDGNPFAHPGVTARTLIVRPTIWQATWFRVIASAVIALLLAAISATWQRHRSRALLRASEQRRALAEERSRISRDMHDEVGSGLTEIALLSTPVPVNDAQRASAEVAAMSRINARCRELLDAIGTIIWALNPDNDRLDRLLALLREATDRQCESFGIEALFELPDAVAAMPVSASFARHLTLMVREVVNNCGKHASARALKLQVMISPAQIEIIISDDGQGFEQSAVARGHGLGHLHTRARELGGTSRITTQPGQGCLVAIQVPLKKPR